MFPDEYWKGDPIESSGCTSPVALWLFLGVVLGLASFSKFLFLEATLNGFPQWKSQSFKPKARGKRMNIPHTVELMWECKMGRGGPCWWSAGSLGLIKGFNEDQYHHPFAGKFEMAHLNCFPEHGKVRVCGLKVSCNITFFLLLYVLFVPIIKYYLCKFLLFSFDHNRWGKNHASTTYLNHLSWSMLFRVQMAGFSILQCVIYKTKQVQLNM